MKAVLLILRVATSSRRLLQTVAALAILFSATLAFAHELRPAYLELREEKPGEFSVLWKTPMLGEGRLSLEPEFSGDAQAVTPVTTSTPPGAAIQKWTLRAPALRGQTLRIRGLEGTMTDALVRIEFADGTTWVQRLTGQEPSAIIPMRQSGWSVAGVYLKLGVEHISVGHGPSAVRARVVADHERRLDAGEDRHRFHRRPQHHAESRRSATSTFRNGRSRQ